jgi:translation initiation factor 5B
VEVLAGKIRPGYKLRKRGKIIGEIKELQSEGENISEAKLGDKVAVSIEGVTLGRQISEGDTLETVLSERDFEILWKLKAKLSQDERDLLEEFEGNNLK